MKSKKVRKNKICRMLSAVVAFVFFINTVITDYAFSLQVPSQMGGVVLQEAAKDLYGLSILRKKIEETRESCDSIGDFYFTIALRLADISYCKADLLVRKEGRVVSPQELEGQLAGLGSSDRIQRVNDVVDEILIRLSNGDIILRYCVLAANIPNLDSAISVGEKLQMKGQRNNLTWDTYYTEEFAERIKAAVGKRDVKEVAEELARPLPAPETAPAIAQPEEARQAQSDLTIWLIKALRASIVPIVTLILIAGYKLLAGDTADHTDHIGPSAGIGPIVLAGILLDQIGIRLAGFREWITGRRGRPGKGYQERKLAIETLEDKKLLSPVAPVDLSADLKNDNTPAMVGPLTAGQAASGQMIANTTAVDHAVTGLYSEGEAGTRAEGGIHSEWHVTVGTTTTYLTLDSNQFAESWNGYTYVYDRDLDMVYSLTSQDAGALVSRRGYGKFDQAMNDMERNLRLIGENGLADRLVSGELYNQDPGRREWHKTIGTTTTFFTLDSKQFAMSWNGNTYVYDRDFDMLYYLTSQDNGALLTRRGYGQFTREINNMAYLLRYNGEDDLADKLISGALYNLAPAPGRREWHVTVGTTTTYLTLDSKQFAVSWNGYTYVYDRDLDMVYSLTSQDAGALVSRRGYGKFTAAMNDMERSLRLIGENGLADQLVSGELYNYQQVFTPTPGTTIQIDAERSIYFSTYNEWRITESVTNRISDTVNLDGAISHYEVPDRGPTTRIEYDRNGTYIRGNIDNRAFEYGFDRFDDYVKEIFRIRRLMYSWRDEIAKDPARAETARLLDLAIVEFYNRMPAQKTVTYYYGTGGVLGVRALANGEIQRPADPRYYKGSLGGEQYWFDSIRPESVISDGGRVTAKVIEVGIGQSLPPIFKWEDEVLTPETGFNGIARPNDDELREYLIRLDRVMELLHRMQGDVSRVVKPGPQPLLDQFYGLRQRVYGAFEKAGIILPALSFYTSGKENEYSIYMPNGDLEGWTVQKIGTSYRFHLKSRITHEDGIPVAQYLYFPEAGRAYPEAGIIYSESRSNEQNKNVLTALELKVKEHETGPLHRVIKEYTSQRSPHSVRGWFNVYWDETYRVRFKNHFAADSGFGTHPQDLPIEEHAFEGGLIRRIYNKEGLWVEESDFIVTPLDNLPHPRVMTYYEAYTGDKPDKTPGQLRDKVRQETLTYDEGGNVITRTVRIRHDVNNDGFVTPIDVLIVINFINKYGTGTTAPTPNPEQDGIVDVNEDTFITPIDVLQVINYLNRQTAAGETAARVSAEGEAYLNEINKSIPGLPRDARMKAKWDGRKGEIIVDVSAGPKDEPIATAFITRSPATEEARRPQPPRAKPADAADSVSMTKEAVERLQAEGKTEATTAEIMGTLALILGERELREAQARGLPFQEEKPDADRLKTIFRRDPNDNPILVKISVEALENLTIGEVNERFGPYRAIGNLYIRLFSIQRPDELIVEREVYEKYGLEDSMDKACPITDETSSKENTITLWCSDTDVDRADLQKPEYAGIRNSVILSIGRKDPDKDIDDPSGIMRGIYFGARGVQIARYVKTELGGRQDVSYNDLKETDIREYIENTVRRYRRWLYVFGLRDAGLLNHIGPQLFIDMATSIEVNKVFRALRLLISLTPIRRFDISALRKLRDAIAILEAAA